MKAALPIVLAFGSGIAFGAWQDDPEPATEPPAQEAFRLDDLIARAKEAGRSWTSFLDRPTLSAGLYRLAAGAEDGQKPHRLDELYYCASGKGSFTAGEETHEVGAGSILFIAADVDHRNYDIVPDDDLFIPFSG